MAVQQLIVSAMKLGKLVHFEPWGDEPLIRLSRRQTIVLFEEILTYVVLPIFVFWFCPRFAAWVEPFFR